MKKDVLKFKAAMLALVFLLNTWDLELDCEARNREAIQSKRRPRAALLVTCRPIKSK